MTHVNVTIIHKNKKETFRLRKGLGFQALGTQSPIPIEFDCRDADCGICIVRVLEGLEQLSDKTYAEADFLKAMHALADERLACQCRIFGDVTVEVET